MDCKLVSWIKGKRGMFRTVNGENALHKYIWNGTDNGIEWDLEFIYIYI